MKLRELSESIATACDIKPKAVAAVHAETFRQIRDALGKGERVQIPEFGLFYVKAAEAKDGGPAKKLVRFRQRDKEAGEARQEGAKNEGRKKRAKDAAETAAAAAPAKTAQAKG